MRKTQQQLFDAHIWKSFSASDEFDKLKYQLNRVRKIMMRQQDSFKKMTAIRQFDYCITICCIAIQTSHKDLRQFRMAADKNKVFPYSINEGFEEPEVINIETEANPFQLLSKSISH